MDARDAVADAIRDHGPITFAEYMDLALYGPRGFYERPPIGPDGDFVTSPHVHPIFGELLARALTDLHARLGEPRPFLVTEVGAGDGTLARQLIGRLATIGGEYTAVERSPGARLALAGIDGVAVADRIDGSPHVIVANELLDNLPFRRFRGTAGGTKEVAIGLDGDRLVEVLAEPPPGHAELPEGAETILHEGAGALLDDVAARLARPGYALLIDYGGVGDTGGLPHGYRAHRPVGDLLDRPGEIDITAGVDFAVVGALAEDRGLVAFPPVTQRHALTSLGFDAWIRDELRKQQELLDRREGVDAVRTWSGRSRATLLVDPSVLGRLRWLLLATPGLEAPVWM